MRYIGGKSKLNDIILETIREVAPDAKTVIDAFSGSGAVANFLKANDYNVVCNDLLYFSFILLRGVTQLNKTPKFKKLGIKDPIDYLNNLFIADININLKNCFIYQNYAPHDDCDRMYFQTKNAIKIDVIRQTIEQWKTDNKLTADEYYYLLASLIAAVPFISNIAGVYAAYLKHWDTRAYKELTLEHPKLLNSNKRIIAYNMTVNDLVESQKADVLYSDSPYNSREYLPNYHILETIAKYDNPTIKGVTGMRDYTKQKSEFCSKETAKQAFEMMISKANVEYIVISYNNEGLVSTDELSDICKKYAVDGTFQLKEIPYRRYKSKMPNNAEGLVEQLYVFQKKKFSKSPMNYIGGKFKLLPQIYTLFPTGIDIMVDLFCGGVDVASNIVADNVVCNDINNFVIDIYKTFQDMSCENLLMKIHEIIDHYHLSKTNKDGYLQLRDDYNGNVNGMHNPITLYVLLAYAFNHQLRFNSSHKFNSPFGTNRSEFNAKMESNLIIFYDKIKSFNFISSNFKDIPLNNLSSKSFLYADPPYRITTGAYNDGKRGFEGWSENDDLTLCALLDNLNERGIRFAMSNVLYHKGKSNDILIEWSKKYTVHHLSFDYNNSSYHGKNTDTITDEVLITNY